MRPDIHPTYKPFTAICSCGRKIQSSSTLQADEIRLEVCSKCHPFYTGQRKIIAEGRVQSFNKRYRRSAEKPADAS